MPASAWTRWKRFAHRAAEIQANVLFLILYFAGIVPMKAIGLGRADGEAADSRPRWISRTRATSDMTWARRQF